MVLTVGLGPASRSEAGTVRDIGRLGGHMISCPFVLLPVIIVPVDVADTPTDSQQQLFTRNRRFANARPFPGQRRRAV